MANSWPWRMIGRVATALGAGTDTSEISDQLRLCTEEAAAIYAASRKDDETVPEPGATLDAPRRDLDSLGFAAGALLEMGSLRTLHPTVLRRRAWEIRERFHLIFGDDRYRSYTDSKPPDPESADRVTLLADLQTLMKSIAVAYILARGRERQIHNLKKNIFIWSGGAWTIAMTVWIALDFDESHYRTIPLLALFGLFGSTVSIFRRLQALAVTNASATDPALELMSLRLGGIGVIVALLSGWVFAMLIGIMLQANFISIGELAPKFKPDEILIPCSPADLGKLLVFAFVAGFAERFVPDVIDRLTQKASGPA